MKRLLLMAFVALTPLSSLASGIAMHGAPKYAEGFTHFDYANPDAPQGGDATFSILGSFDSLNPFILRGVSLTVDQRNLVYQSLLARALDEPFSLYPQIAEAVEMAADRSWIRFTIDPAARFSDGEALTAEDVVFSWQTLRDEGRPNHRAYYSKVDRVAVDGNTVTFHFAPDADAEMPLIMGLMPVLPQHFFDGRAFNEPGLTPIPGSGPYRIAEVVPQQKLVLEKVPDWWGNTLPVAQGHFNFDRLRFDYYRDATTALEAFKAGLVEIRREGDAKRWANGYDGPNLDSGAYLKREFSHGRPAGMFSLVFNTRRSVFADRRTREALSLIFDFEWVNKHFFFSSYQRTASFFENSELEATGVPSQAELALLEPFQTELPEAVFGLPPEPAVNGDTTRLRANMRKAFQLLNEAGWISKGAQLVDPEGKPFRFEIMITDPSQQRLALHYTNTLKRLGIRASVRLVDSAQFEGRRNTYDFDMIFNLWATSLSPGNEQLYYWGAAAADQQGTRNYMGAKTPAIDALIAAQLAATTRDELVTATRALDRVLRAEHYVIPLYHVPGDRIAWWDIFGMPETLPVQGVRFETWWRK